MNQKLVVFSIVCSLSLVIPTEAFTPSKLHWGTKGVIAGVHHSIVKSIATVKGVGAGVVATAAKGVTLPVIATKKAILLAPIAIPLALGGKAILAAKLALPMAVGAAVGAPVGALIGAKAGALKGALVGKAIIAAKLGLVKKAAVAGTALALKPIILIGGAKAKLAALKLGLLGKAVIAAGAVAAKAGASIKSSSEKLSSFTDVSKISLPTLSLPQLPALPALPVDTKKKGPTSIEYSFVVNGPHTGYKSKKASFYSNRRRRDAEPEAEAEAEPQQGQNAQQLLALVRSQNAQQCLQRVICELSANPNSHGNEGIRFGRSLISLESQTDRASAAQYRQAATTGSQVQNAQSCKQFFPTCAFQSNEIIRMGNQMIGG